MTKNWILQVLDYNYIGKEKTSTASQRYSSFENRMVRYKNMFKKQNLIIWTCLSPLQGTSELGVCHGYLLCGQERQQHNKSVPSYGKNSPKFEFLSYSLTVRRIVLPRKLSFYPCIMWQGIEPTFCKIIGVKQTVPI